MKHLTTNELRQAIESKHSCRAGLAESVLVKLTFAGSTVWEGFVHIFDLAGHPEATQAYAWSSPIAGTKRERLFSMLHHPPVTSPIEAVRSAILGESNTV